MAMDCTYRLRIPHGAGQLAKVSTRICEYGGLIGDVSTIAIARHEAIREITIELRDKEHADALAVDSATSTASPSWWFHDRAFIAHDGGKIKMVGRATDQHQPGCARRLHARRRAGGQRDLASTRSSPGASR